jgi:acyl carrier protein
MSIRERRPAEELTAEEKTTVNRVLSSILRVPSAKIAGGNLLRDDLGMDSVQAIECLAVLEKELRLVVDPERAFDVKTVEDLYALLQKSERQAQEP